MAQAKITQKQLEKLQQKGIKALPRETPAPVVEAAPKDDGRLLKAIESLITSLSSQTNAVVVSNDKAAQKITRAIESQPKDAPPPKTGYTFTVKRDKNGFIKSVEATPREP